MKISIAIGENVATSCAIAAARMLVGLNQAALAMLASVSPATTSNVERGHGVRDDTLHVPQITVVGFCPNPLGLEMTDVR